MRKALKRMLLALLVVAGVVFVSGYAYVQHPKFGRLPEGDRQRAVEASPNFADGEFRNLVTTPMFTEGTSFGSVIVGNLFMDRRGLTPPGPVPTVKTDLKNLDRAHDVVVWLGHSAFFVQLGGKRILVDPVFSATAAPLPGANEAFEGTSVYSAEDMPEIDYLLITHDHWDHLDYPSVCALELRTRRVVTGLGVGAYFEQWGYPPEKILEADWFDVLEPDPGFAIHVLPARHYSSRLTTRNGTLWSAFAVEAAGRRIFFSGDTGLGPHFAEIGRRFGGFDLAVLDLGQYDSRWPHIHMTPEEAAQAAEQLRAKALLPAHVGKFAIARHSWDEPFRRIVAASEGKAFRLLTPEIGDLARVGGESQRFARWWETLQQRGRESASASPGTL
jgi:L-ascorbate metabolism protein UlaG (beta-lactamase superfamily)